MPKIANAIITAKGSIIPTIIITQPPLINPHPTFCVWFCWFITRLPGIGCPGAVVAPGLRLILPEGSLDFSRGRVNTCRGPPLAPQVRPYRAAVVARGAALGLCRRLVAVPTSLRKSEKMSKKNLTMHVPSAATWTTERLPTLKRLQRR